MDRVNHRDSDKGSRIDWRGWTGVAWVVIWGLAYAVMAMQARAPQMLRWLGQPR